MVQIDAFDVFAFVVFGVLLVAVVAMIVVVGSLPGKVAAQRGHPQAKAIAAAGWISLITLGALWPIAFVWAFIPPRANRPAGEEGSPA
jgi:hypothetical protein